ncbi:MAG: type I-U CRISPR-associated RAMP protein Csb1/Cas7u [Parvularculaceae bacterium]
MAEPLTLTHEIINSWADDKNGPVALHLKQKLIPVEGEGAVIFPPTYADIGYNIDTLSDGTKVATIDSVGSQANRMEPIFKEERFAKLVPQIDITYGNEKVVSILDAGHRLGDAIIRCTELQKEAQGAFKQFLDAGDVSAIAALAPTSLVFGVWDSRGTHAKLPRIVQSVIRAWDITELHRAAQYVPPLDYVAEDLLEEPKDKAEADLRSSKGYRHAPAIWRDEGRKEKVLGGVLARGPIERNVTVNLIALRRLGGSNALALRRYILGLSLVAACEPVEAFLRAGCMVTPDPEAPARWASVARDGKRVAMDLDDKAAKDYAEAVSRAHGVAAPKRVNFDKKLAQEDLIDSAGKKGRGKGKTQPAPTAAATT